MGLVGFVAQRRILQQRLLLPSRSHRILTFCAAKLTGASSCSSQPAQQGPELPENGGRLPSPPHNDERQQDKDGLELERRPVTPQSLQDSTLPPERIEEEPHDEPPPEEGVPGPMLPDEDPEHFPYPSPTSSPQPAPTTPDLLTQLATTSNAPPQAELPKPLLIPSGTRRALTRGPEGLPAAGIYVSTLLTSVGLLVASVGSSPPSSSSAAGGTPYQWMGLGPGLGTPTPLATMLPIILPSSSKSAAATLATAATAAAAPAADMPSQLPRVRAALEHSSQRGMGYEDSQLSPVLPAPAPSANADMDDLLKGKEKRPLVQPDTAGLAKQGPQLLPPAAPDAPKRGVQEIPKAPVKPPFKVLPPAPVPGKVQPIPTSPESLNAPQQQG